MPVGLFCGPGMPRQYGKGKFSLLGSRERPTQRPSLWQRVCTRYRLLRLWLLPIEETILPWYAGIIIVWYVAAFTIFSELQQLLPIRRFQFTLLVILLGLILWKHVRDERVLLNKITKDFAQEVVLASMQHSLAARLTAKSELTAWIEWYFPKFLNERFVSHFLGEFEVSDGGSVG